MDWYQAPSPPNTLPTLSSEGLSIDDYELGEHPEVGHNHAPVECFLRTYYDSVFAEWTQQINAYHKAKAEFTSPSNSASIQTFYESAERGDDDDHSLMVSFAKDYAHVLCAAALCVSSTIHNDDDGFDDNITTLPQVMPSERDLITACTNLVQRCEARARGCEHIFQPTGHMTVRSDIGVETTSLTRRPEDSASDCAMDIRRRYNALSDTAQSIIDLAVLPGTVKRHLVELVQYTIDESVSNGEFSLKNENTIVPPPSPSDGLVFPTRLLTMAGLLDPDRKSRY
jgi:hypothetical protein